MRVLICGDRHWIDEAYIRKVIKRLNPTVIIEGGASGADQLAGKIGLELGIEVLEFKADWKIGKAAGPIRNKLMLTKGKPDLVIAFHHKIKESKGTKNMLVQAEKAGIKTIVYK